MMRSLAAVLVYACVTLGAVAAAAAPEAADAGTRPAADAVDEVDFSPGRLSDEAAMVLAGTALIGAAYAVRRAA